MKSFFVILILCLTPASIYAQTPQPLTATNAAETKTVKPVAKSFSIPPEKAVPVSIARFEKSPVIDGRLDDEAWKSATVLKDFFQVNPGDNIEPSKQTEVLIGYDSKILYIAFRAHDESGKVRATVPKRDNIFSDDYVGMFLDTFNDKRKAYALFFSPLGIQADGTMTEGQGEDYSLDIVMDSKGTVDEDGYTVEIAIPFKSLRYEAGKDKVWGAHFFRRIKRFNNELDSWMPMSRDISGTLNQTGHLGGLIGISTERTLEIIPSLTISESGKRIRTIGAAILDNNPALNDPGRFLNRPPEFDPGLTVKFGITPTVTLDFAANPDFAQVEADQTVITTNQRFPIFFAEKRPFFLEGIDIFQTSLQAVHTRTIVDPDLAVKLTGKQGRTTFGLMMASDNAPGNFSDEERTDPDLLPDIERFLDKNAYIGVLRLKRDIGKENSLGLIATSYNFIERHNQLAGFDGRFKLDKQTTFSFQALGTTSRRDFYDPQLDDNRYRTGNGFAYSIRYEKDGRHFGYNFDGEGRSRDYRADVGFTRRTNTNREGFFAYYASEPNPKGKIIQWRAFSVIATNFDWDGRIQSWVNESQFRVNLPKQSFLAGGFQKGYERLFEEEFGPARTLTRAGAFFGNDSERSTNNTNVYAYGGTTPSKKYSIFIFGSYILNSFDFDFGGGSRFPRISPAALADPDAPLDPGPGKEFYLESQFVYQPTDALRTDFSFTKDRLRRNDTGLLAFDDNIFALRATYQFTRFIFARARVDYDTLASSVRGQYLLGWTPNPGTSFYAGYNDDLNYNGFSPFTSRREPGFQRNGRTFFIKMSYLFRRGI